MPYYNKFSVSINPDKIPLYNSVVYNNTLVCLAQIQLTLELYGRSIILDQPRYNAMASVCITQVQLDLCICQYLSLKIQFALELFDLQ